MNTWNKTHKHFGEVTPDTYVSYDFVYLGDKEILSTASSCGCTVSKLKNNKLTVTLNTGSLRDNQEYKKKSSNVTVLYNDTTKDILTVEAVVCRTL